MNASLVRVIYRPVAKEAVLEALTGRNRDRHNPSRSRFTRAEVKAVLKRAWQRYEGLAPHVPREPKFGNRMNVQLACLSLALFQVLLGYDLKRKYAIELVGDVTWKVYRRWAGLPYWIAGMITHDPLERMRIPIRMFMRFPFTQPGYQFEFLPDPDRVALDILRCPVAEYFDKNEAADLCRGTWCNLDFALAEIWGGSLERTGTLAGGSTRCDFRFVPTAGDAN